jgi:acetyltransferase-like isoleucine patch superfamily enzyme
MSATPYLRLAFKDRPDFEIGEHSYGITSIADYGGAKLKIGDYCCFAQSTQIMIGGQHRIDWATSYPFPALWPEAEAIGGYPMPAKDTVIGNDVWLGAQTLVLGGVTIGDGAVVYARSVVDRDLPPYSISAGQPARVIGRRFSPETIARLLLLRWWSWPREKIVRFLPLMCSHNVEAFLDAAEKEQP